MITKYITYLRHIRGYSENTCKAYEKDLRAFATWLRANSSGARWGSVTRTEIDKYITQLATTGLKPSTTNRRLASISGIYDYFKREGYEVENPCKYESRRKQEKTLPNTINYHDLEEAYERAYGIVKVMLGILITTGIRIQELLDLKWEDIDFNRCTLKIHGKGNKQRIVFMLPEQLETLHEVYQLTPQSGQIFTQSQREARLMIYKALKPYSRSKQLSPHAIRHTFATHMAEEGVNCSTLAEILGHNKLDTTQRYINLGQHAAQTAMQAHSILKN